MDYQSAPLSALVTECLSRNISFPSSVPKTRTNFQLLLQNNDLIQKPRKSWKTPLRYPGGKSKALLKLARHFPEMTDISEIVDPFLGGGSLMIYLTKRFPHISLVVSDIFLELTNFWKTLQGDGLRLYLTLRTLKEEHPDPETARILFEAQKKILENSSSSQATDPFDQAVAFYIVNKCSFSGLISSSFSQQASVSNFSVKCIEALPYYSKLIQKWTIHHADYRETILSEERNPNSFIYLDPPYAISSNLYGLKGELHEIFSHEDFIVTCTELNALSLKHMVSYNGEVLEQYQGSFDGYTISDYDLTYTMRSTGSYMADQKQRKELVIKNY
jgi:site-specific DNA-adenine methylase